ncbi:MAG: hypothetical protein AAFQ89_23360, partial [Cyanobacteria bacterium J06626_18]
MTPDPRPVEVQAVTTTTDRDQFLDLPAQIYRDDPNWVPPLRSSIAKQLSVASLMAQYCKFQPFLALRDRQPVGRIVAAINQRLIEKENQQVGLFGYFESINDTSVAKALLQAACQWLQQRHIAIVRGPIDLSLRNSAFFLVDGFDSSPMVMMPYNPKYYPDLMKKIGWQKAKDAYAYNFPLYNHELSQQFEKGYQIACKSGISFRPIRIKGEGFEQDCHSLYRIFTESFRESWSSTYLTEEEFWEEARELKSLIDPDVFPVAEDKGKMIGFWMGLPDYNIPLKQINGKLNWLGILKFIWYRRQIDQGRVITICSLPEYRRKMVPLGLIHLGMQGGIQKGKPYKRAELSWVWEDNMASRKL